MNNSGQHGRAAVAGRVGATRPRGVAAVEMALVLPLLVLVVFGGVDFGRFAYSYIAITNAARTGAEFGSVNPFTTGTKANWDSQLRQRVVEEMQPVMDADSDFGPDNLQVTATRVVEADAMWRIRVVAAYPFRTMVTWPGIPKQVQLTRAVEMRGIR